MRGVRRTYDCVHQRPLDDDVAVEEAGLLAALAGVIPDLTLDDGVTIAGASPSGALQAFKMTREAADPGISAGKSIGSMISAMGGALFATPAGPVLKTVGAAIGGAMTVTALRALAVFGIGAEELASHSDEELRAKVINAQGVATKNIGTRVSEGVSGIGTYFSDTGGAMIQHYRADIAERTARAKDLMLYGDAASGKTHNRTKVRADWALRSLSTCRGGRVGARPA